MYTSLQNAGYILVFKPTVEITKDGEKSVKGNVDAELVLNAMIQYPNYDKAVIVAGDGDYHCLVEYLDAQNKLLKIIVPNDTYSSLLRKYSGYIVKISSFRRKLEYRYIAKNKKEAFPRDETLR